MRSASAVPGRRWCGLTRNFRPAEVETLLGDPTRVREKLGWTPTTTLEELVAETVAADKEEPRKEAILRLEGFNVVGTMDNPPTNPGQWGRRGGSWADGGWGERPADPGQ
jgi:GDPmannose 4,6-dehydratase